MTTTPQAERERIQITGDALKRVGRVWPKGVDLARLKDHNPSLDAILSAAEGKLDQAWQAARQGLYTMPEFKAAVQAWESCHYDVIEAMAKVRR